MPDTSLDTEAERTPAERSGKGPCEACDASFCEFD